jgi:hypothetical protein
MSKASDRPGVLGARHLAALALVLGCAGAAAEVAVTTNAPALRDGIDPAANYQVRCWQKGRLIFDESGVALPRDIAAGAVRLRGHDRQQRPLYVIETANATCFAKPVEVPAAPPGLPGSGAR